MDETDGPIADPIDTFLRFALVALDAGRLDLWRLDRRSELWVPRRQARARSWPDLDIHRIEAVGHPLTWAHREELLLQVPSRRIIPGASEGDWTLVGPVPGERLVLTVGFRTSPPERARSGLKSALRHVAVLGALVPELDPPAGS